MTKAKYIEYNYNTGEITNSVVMEEEMEPRLGFKYFIKCSPFVDIRKKQIDLNTKELVDEPTIEEKKIIPLFQKITHEKKDDYLKSVFFSNIFQIIQFSIIIILLWRK